MVYDAHALLRATGRGPVLAALALLLLCHCGKHKAASNGVVVRQVLHGSEVAGDAQVAGNGGSDVAPKALQPGQVPTTLVADLPQAVYKQSADATRRKLENDGPRQALNQLESQIEQEQESAP